MHCLTVLFSFIVLLSMKDFIYSYPIIVSSSLTDLPPSQIDHLCSYISSLPQSKDVQTTTKPSDLSKSPQKRLMPFPDMNRFLSTSHKLHHHGSNTKSGTADQGTKKHDFHAYLCSITKDSEEILNFINIFVQEHGQPPAFNIFESCELIAKRDQLEEKDNKKRNIKSSAGPLNELVQFCSNRLESRFTKRWKHSVGGPMSIDFIHQMLESRKVKSYPYSAEVDPYLVG